MTEPNRSMNEVPGLIEERRRYEGWLAALDARRDTTPAHVFERVRADYRARLQRVGEELASHRQAIEEERASVQSRLSLLEAEERLRRDERAELELRAHVGELVGDDADSAFRAVDDAIQQLVSEKEGLEVRVGELQALLDEGAPRALPDETSETSETSEMSPAPADAAPSPQAAVPSEQGTESSAASAAHAEAEAAVATAISEASHAGEASEAGELPGTGAATADAVAPQPAASQESAPTAPAVGQRTQTPSFDELAFLSSVVGANDDSITSNNSSDSSPLGDRREAASLMSAQPGGSREDQASESLLAGLENSKRATGDHPLAANVPANTPIVLRPTGTIEQSKTLKCSECGAMNYPTEWYCERCGAELAAL